MYLSCVHLQAIYTVWEQRSSRSLKDQDTLTISTYRNFKPALSSVTITMYIDHFDNTISILRTFFSTDGTPNVMESQNTCMHCWLYQCKLTVSLQFGTQHSECSVYQMNGQTRSRAGLQTLSLMLHDSSYMRCVRYYFLNR